ncbi:MAG: patatin-like phospholipase family protein [Actinobacteria bacterium]|nr:patatin-like phospholipase family protein [Actinomycetota bacterium]
MTASNDLDVAGALQAVPLFATLAPHELDSLLAVARIRVFGRSDLVFREGDPSVSCFVVVSGEVDVTTGGRKGTPVQVRRLGATDLFGELGVLLGRNRTASVAAARPATLLEVPAEEFRRVVTANPLALEQVSRLLAARLISTTRGDRTSNTPRVLMVTGEAKVPGRSLVAASLAALLHEITDRTAVWVELFGDGDGRPEAVSLEAIAADPSSVPSGPTGWAGGTRRLEVATGRTGTEDIAALLAEAVDKLRTNFTFVIVDVPGNVTLSSESAAQIGDAVVHVSHRSSLPPAPKTARRLLVLNQRDDRTRPVPINTNEPFVLRRDPALAELTAAAAAEHVLRNRKRPSPTTRSLDRLARTILGTTVGVALGGGAAFGLAHVGVLEALDEHRIPVDMIVGCSMGSIVATAYGAGIPTDEMHEVAERIGRSPRTLLSLLDPNPTRPGVLSGRRLQQTFNPLLGSIETFDDLAVPCRTVAADIESGERVCIGSGRLEDAFRASSSIPMLIAPWLHDGHILVDGAMVDPVPAEVTREMGADLAIAVNVVPHLHKGVTTIVSRAMRGISNVNPLAAMSRSRGMPGYVDTAMNTIQALQHELGHFKAASADVRINPNLADVTWIEFYKAPLIIERGREGAEESLPAIRRVLAERLAAALPDD